MDNTLRKFLEVLGIKEESICFFEDAIVEKAELIESKQIILVYVMLDDFLPVQVFDEFNDAIDKHQFNIKLIINMKQTVYSQKSVLEYYYFFLNKYFINESNRFLSELNVQYINKVLSVILFNEGMRMIYNPIKIKLEALMQRAGFNIKFDYVVDDQQELNKKIDNLVRNEDRVLNLDRFNQEKKQLLNSDVQKENRTFYKKSITDLSSHDLMPIKDLYEDLREVCIEGYIFDIETNKLRSGKHLQTIKLTDFDDSIILKRFEGRGISFEDLTSLKKGTWIRVLGDVKYDTFANQHVMMLQALVAIDSQFVEVNDTAEKKRVELHLHTNMSTMDGISHISDYIKQAIKYGHRGLAITDHGNIQAFPDAQNGAIGKDIKIIYGLETNLIDDSVYIVSDATNQKLKDITYVHFDFETTGLSSSFNEIIEIGAVKYQNGHEIDRFQTFVKPIGKVSLFIKELTGIGDKELRDAPTIEEVLPQFIEFYQDHCLVAHNASFDISFLNAALRNAGRECVINPVIDTLLLSRALDPKQKTHNLGACARAYGVAYDTTAAHRADYDALVLGQIFEGMIEALAKDNDLYTLEEINSLCDAAYFVTNRPYHASILVKNQAGLKDLFKLVSIANIKYFYKEPNLLKSTIVEYRKDLLIGSGCINSEVYQKVGSLDKDSFLKLLDFYDYIEVYPEGNFSHLIDLEIFKDLDHVRDTNRYIIECAKEINKIVVASGDSHYVSEQQKIYREVYISALGIGGKLHPLFDRRGRIRNIPNQHFKTTNEMLADFAYLGSSLAMEIVVENTNYILDQIEPVQVIKDKLFTPKIDGVDDKLTEMCYENARSQYGDILPEIVENRLKKELSSIIKHGFSVVYYISSQLVTKSLEDGYLVGSRGSVGSSFVATMSNITEVNPLVAHYYCPNCQYSHFFEDGSVTSGYDLPDKKCPQCDSGLKGDGQDIPFETFLGFEGDKVPDIDLNFSGAYQARAHAYTKELFGEEFVYKAGTISTVQAKTAFGYAKGYFEKKGRTENIRSAELERLALGCEGVKRTTGQHPGGIIVIPDYMDVYDFTPVNYPADDPNSQWMTTHFDFHAIHDNVLKLDILGHVDPTAIRMLQDLTKINPKDIPTNDQKVMSLFSSNEALGIESLVSYKNAAIGIPEFGTPFVRGMLEETNPSTFAELVQISGLSHGTDVWLTNAQDLIKRGICTLKEVIGCRDDIMVYLMYNGLEPKLAFTIMESVRKGKGLKEEWIKDMKKNEVPQWYIDSCLKIKYMFPKAHAAAYVLMAIRVAWFKVYYPLEYYATYFTTRCDQFDIETMIEGKNSMLNKIKEIEAKGYEASAKDKALIIVFEVSLEMYYRGFTFSRVDLYKSDSTKFIVDHDNKCVIPPFTSIDGLGENVARTVLLARQDNRFISKEDLEKRTSLNYNHIAFLDRIKALEGLSEFNQGSLF